ncbi:MAG TPA: class I SAM-dependent methyltransferase [Allosphingosinicella sp.]|jgi:SAM-dependent methyltransferase
MSAKAYSRLYEGRKLAQAYPDLDAIATEHFAATPMGAGTIADTLEIIERLVDLPETSKSVAIVGCGPLPASLKAIQGLGYDAVGVEPVPGFVATAREFLGESGAQVVEGAAEKLPFEDESLAVVLLESVLEHVDSPSKSLAEAYRVLAPGGVAFIETSNRRRFHPLGKNGEYNLPFYNFYPKTVKEAIVHHHLHFNPKLANYSTRPAVHWFTYADLCARGREAGFHRFYARFDGWDTDDPSAGSRLRRAILRMIKYSPFFRTLALLQYGGAVFMLKR